ncbi:hypothetical protein CAPTEDRAFT_207246 [Capitella teleta]|uniref:Uncharacterized protein n=1 Tax=Capitella teleta TaxID=283909 RepID=R7TT40_CAPTE|nr:hypothetical protein CAPTEDRAFT_207246 [Capitella teleta]|eukprot:ELT94661.1 hypothetical protein CAPTEDRAFT_207246 [Capitella teleta]
MDSRPRSFSDSGGSFPRSKRPRKSCDSQTSVFGGFFCSSFGSQIFDRLFRRPSKCDQNSKTFITETKSADLNSRTDFGSFTVEKYKIGSSESSFASLASTSTSGSYSVAAKEDNPVRNELDKQLVHLENLVRSLEDLEMRLADEQAMKECDEMITSLCADSTSTSSSFPSSVEGSYCLSGNDSNLLGGNLARSQESWPDGFKEAESGTDKHIKRVIILVHRPRSLMHANTSPQTRQLRALFLYSDSRVDEVLAAAEVLSPRGRASTPRGKPTLPLNRTPTPMPNEKKHLWCELCNSRLVELKKQAVKMWMPLQSRRQSHPYKQWLVPQLLTLTC